MAPNVRIKNHWNEQRIFAQRTFAAMTVVALLGFVLLGRLVYLQIVKHDYYVELSLGNRVRLEPIPASRGLIRDRHGVILADNAPAYQLELVREQVPDLSGTLRRLTALGLIDPDELEATRRIILERRSFDPVPVQLRLTDEQIGTFAVHRFEFPGVDLATRQTRHYPYGDLAVHALGYVGAISEQDLEHIDRTQYTGTALIGKLGVESAYEDQLHGKNGYRQVLVNALGRTMQRVGPYAPELTSLPPTAGDDLILSIDLPTQQAAEEALGTHTGAVVALDPSNGDVLALASEPGFDPAAFARGLTTREYAALADDPDKPLLNRALRGGYPSGSTIKPAIALAGLTYHVIDPNKTFYSTGIFHLPGNSFIWREDKTGPRGAMDMDIAIARSSDVYFYTLASILGVDRIDTFLAPFGYGRLTGIDISGEKPGLLPSPAWKKTVFRHPQDQVWFPGETVNLGVGQGYLLVTPLQLAHIAGVLAERGKSFRPRLMIGTRDAHGHVTPAPPIEEASVQGISDASWDLVLRAMHHTMTCEDSATYGHYCGTGYAAFKTARYLAAGKTGTAQVFTVARSQRLTQHVAEQLKDHAWFIAFAPVDKPRIAVAVLVEHVGFGAEFAAPIARQVIDTYLLGPQAAQAQSVAKPGAGPKPPATPGKPPVDAND